MHHLHLAAAILFEVAGTSALQASQQFTRFWPSLAVVVCYGAAFFFLSLTLRVLPVGLVYAIWSGLGVLLISLAGRLFFGQSLDAPALLGMGLIVAGVIIIRVWSDSGA